MHRERIPDILRMMNTHFPVLALIAAPEGILGSSLCTFLETLPEVQVIGRATTQAETFGYLGKQRPNLLLLDCDLNSGRESTSLTLKAFIHHIRALNPEMHIIAIASYLAQKQLALDSGASQVILRGGFDQPLHQAVEQVSIALQTSSCGRQ